MSLLEVRGLTTAFATERGEINAVEDINFNLNEGEILGIVGESGSGKSVTALTIMGLLPRPPARIVAGRIKFAGQELTALSEPRMERIRGSGISMVFQEPMTSMNPVFTIGEQIMETVRAHERASAAEQRKRAIDMLDLVGIPSASRRLGDYPHQLSGGQRQRVVLAMAIANDPAVLLCDEPTTALDVTVQARILDLVIELVRTRDTALLFITHDLAVVSRVCERVLVMYGGCVVETGPVEQVFSRSLHPYTAGLLHASDVDAVPSDVPLATVAGSVPAAGAFPTGCVFRDRCPRALAVCAQMPALVPVAGPGDRLLACHNPVGSEPS